MRELGAAMPHAHRQPQPSELYEPARSTRRVPSAREEIARILSEVETDGALPHGMLKKVYDMEAGVVHLRSRERIYSDLRETIADAAAVAAAAADDKGA